MCGVVIYVRVAGERSYEIFDWKQKSRGNEWIENVCTVGGGNIQDDELIEESE